MPDRIFTEKEKVKPDKVFATTTDNLIELPKGKDIVFDGDEGKAVFDNWWKQSKDQKRDMTIRCGSSRLTFKYKEK